MNNLRKIVISLIVLTATQLACGQPVDDVKTNPLTAKEVDPNGNKTSNNFGDPQPVTILGYDGNTMEPFISRNDQYLFFNNSNAQIVDTNLHYAVRIDDMTFQYMGEISNVNSEMLDAVASMDADGTFYFVSLRKYAETLSTIFKGRFEEGQVLEIEIVDGISGKRPGHVNFDAEIASNGFTIYFVDGQFGDSNIPKVANLVVANKRGETFERSVLSSEIFLHINTDALEYAPAISSDELEIFFTRLEQDLSSPPAIYRAVRNSTEDPFGKPELVSGISGFVEAATLSSDGSTLYYHKKENNLFVIFRVIR